MKVYFIVKRMDGVREERAIYCFSQRTVLIGSELGDLTVNDSEVSEANALIYFKPDGTLHVRDLSLTKGTYVNGVRVDQKRIGVGDHIKVGDLSLEVIGVEDGFRRETLSAPFPLLELA